MTVITDVLDDRALRRVDAIQVMNEWMLEHARRVNAGRSVDLQLATPGVDTTRFRPAERRILDQNPYILCVGRLGDPRKNIGGLLDAYLSLPSDLRQGVRLVLAGSDHPGEAFWSRVNALGLSAMVAFIHRPDSQALLQLFQQASVFALPSAEEGFGMVLLEAMACGIPVISTRCGGPNGIVSDGVDGFLVSVGDMRGMASRLQMLLEDPRRNHEMGVRARQTAENRFADTKAGAAFVDLWLRLARSR